MEQVLAHVGVKYRSGRYPYGSGENPYQHDGNFYKMVKGMYDEGMTTAEIAKKLDIPSTQLKAYYKLGMIEYKNDIKARAHEMKSRGMSDVAIGEELGVAPNTVKNMLADGYQEKLDKTKNTADQLQKVVDDKGVIDIGAGVEREVGVSKDQLKTAAEMLRAEGYNVYTIPIEQMGTGHKTNLQVIAKPGVEWKDIVQDKSIIQSWTDHSVDNGKTWSNILPPEYIDLNRVEIKYDEQGGSQKDGVIELRRGVNDVSLGDSSYAQVRIAVDCGKDGTRYIKGMALYSDDLPPGVDIRVNSNKSIEGGVKEALKSMTEDPDNPFGATIKAGGQTYYDDPNGKYINPKTGKPASISVVNKLTEEGDWSDWSRILPSQFLSKQNQQLIERQLNLTYADREIQFNEIKSLNNPAIKQKLLKDFADSCDADAVDLKAMGLPRQGAHVLLPFNQMKDNEIYAPNYKDGEHVVLIRYPHGGLFEIPELVVNNKQPEVKKLLGNARDAVGINTNVAKILSGADFDGDTVQVIPVNSKVKIKTQKPLKELEGFADKMDELYGPKSTDKPYKRMTEGQNKQTEMGKISNLITDMTLAGAPDGEIARAVKHSMVVIDAVKHKLNYEQSYIDNDIPALKAKYQGGKNAGAGTLISRAGGDIRVNERKQGYSIDPDTGAKIFRETGRTYKQVQKDKKTGEIKRDAEGNAIVKEKKAQTKLEKMAYYDDAYALVSDNRYTKELLYANYANKMKQMGNAARKELVDTPNLTYSKSAAQAYSQEVKDLNHKLNIALLNAPKERQAQAMANAIVDAKKKANPDMSKDSLKKLKNQTLAGARAKYGSSKKDVTIDITDKEWEAIQAGAVSHSKLMQILNNCDMDSVRQRATPRSTTTVSEGNQARIKAMMSSGNYTIAEVANQLGLSTSTVSKYAKITA